MVNLASIILLSGIGLAIFFRKDIKSTLDSFKGFGQVNLPSLPDITVNVPDFGLPEVFGETGKAIDETGKNIGLGLEEAGKNINQFGIDVQKNIAEGIAGAQAGIDESIKGTQESFEQFGQDVNTNLGIISTGFEDAGKGITDFFGGLFPTKEITTISETAPTITTTSRRTGTTTRFGGQTAPKEILTKETATTPELIISEQPDLSLVSPFLKTTQTVEEKPETTTSRFSGSGSRR